MVGRVTEQRPGLRAKHGSRISSSPRLVCACLAVLLLSCERQEARDEPEPDVRHPHLELAAAALRDARGESPPDADLHRGQQVVLGTAPCASGSECFACFTCHGVRGEGSGLAGQPRLSGQVYEYLFESLRNFASGDRQNATMQAVASSLTEQQMRDVSAYYAALPATQPEVAMVAAQAAPSDEMLTQGQLLATAGSVEDGVQACGTCHGPRGEGLPPLYPGIAGQYPRYLEDQLRAFRSGTRRGPQAQLMQVVAENMSDEQMRAAAQFYASAPRHE